ncbi:MAG TPA: YbfB/YjiJ family MFS transporter [Acetobacteraceae bacterium]|nr:YbfB/YjiJ family MFS transporter [Acetobacteraceae bacterium]
MRESEGSVAPWRAAMAGLLALGVAIGVGRFVYTPILPLMVQALGWTRFTAGLVASANFAGYLVGALLAAGPLAGSRRLWLIGALLASAATTGLMGATSSVDAFLVLRFVGGVASAFVLILISAIVLEALARARRLGLSSVLFAGVGSGIAVSAAMVSLLRAAGAGWGALWVATGIASVAAAIGVVMLLPAEQRREDGRGETPSRRGTSRGGLSRLVGAYGLFGFGYVITATFLVAIVRGSPHFRPLEPEIWVVFGLAAVPSVIIWNNVAGRIGIARAYAIASVVEAIGVAVSVAWQSMVGVFLAAVMVGGTFMGLTSLGLILGRQFAGGDARRVFALMTSAFALGQIIGPSFAGTLYDRLGSFDVPSMVAAAALVAAAGLVAR